MEAGRLSRREMLQRGGVAALGGLSVAGLGRYAWPRSASAATQASSSSPGDVLHFVSRPDLSPPHLTVAHHGGPGPADPPYFILAPAGYPRTGPGVPGLMILARDGQIVWYSPNTGFPASAGLARVDLQVQSYRGKPVLTWWEGRVLAGYGHGTAVIADSTYRTVATVNAGHGLSADLHEFVITPQDTALITAYRPMPANLSALGGPARGTVLSGTVQEIDIATGQVLFQWDSLLHVPVTDTYQALSGGTTASPFDYFHINSIAVAPDGDLLVSARNTCTVYKVSRPGGDVVWRLGGKRSSFRMGRGATFWWQHHARPHGATVVSIFDDGASPAKEAQSRAILLGLDTVAMHASLQASYTHPRPLLAANQGSMQVLADGRVLVGWGNLPYFSEFEQDGALITDGSFPPGDQSYRAFTSAWTGYPTANPAVAARIEGFGAVVYASWNGATEVASWTVLAGGAASALAKVGSQPRRGFETAITVDANGPYFAVTAHDAHDRVLGRSDTVRGTN
ncbi:MAG TPA: arylsulfotransferase family protein [Streptosporangiaceae bacterium]|nr:arylsulfotransferase family protein [Streptosporangiaceae bacterium]